MDVNNRKAPKRTIVEINRIGPWGNYQYYHRLDCGHVEVRKRASSAPKIACAGCVRAEAKGRELQQLIAAPQRQAIIDVDDIIDVQDDHLVEVEAGRLRGALAATLSIPQEAVDVIVMDDGAGKLGVSSVVVFLTAADAMRLATNKLQFVNTEGKMLA